MSTLVAQGDVPEARKHRHQKMLTELIHTQRREELLAASDTTATARLMSISAPTTGLWLCPTVLTSSEGVWMRGPIFRVACRMRLGLAVTDTAVSCLRCAAKTHEHKPRDVFGHHSLCCMLGTDRCGMHNDIVRRLMADASNGMLHPVHEAHPFGTNDRLDIALRAGGRESLIDVAITCPFRKTSQAAAAAAPGGAATMYESVKRNRYGHLLGPLQDLVPVVFDTFGAVGVSGRPFLGRVASAFSRRFGSRDARTLFFTRLNTLIVEKAAGIVSNQAAQT
jgi:hypothetical protein